MPQATNFLPYCYDNKAKLNNDDGAQNSLTTCWRSTREEMGRRQTGTFLRSKQSQPCRTSLYAHTTNVQMSMANYIYKKNSQATKKCNNWPEVYICNTLWVWKLGKHGGQGGLKKNDRFQYHNEGGGTKGKWGAKTRLDKRRRHRGLLALASGRCSGGHLLFFFVVWKVSADRFFSAAITAEQLQPESELCTHIHIVLTLSDHCTSCLVAAVGFLRVQC